MRDLLAAGRPVTLVWVKRMWRCVEPQCAVRTWTETSEVIRPRGGVGLVAQLLGEDDRVFAGQRDALAGGGETAWAAWAAWAASPMMIIASRCQDGTRGMSYCLGRPELFFPRASPGRT